ncbi:MAG TPA: sigma-54 dependent transcriptional regulator, partial [Candidatus Manganitrophaceae bacterium]|nr:sigma-54 dependent transcriptional regulator [Candidatus Manganitrophaceae bacterium]
LFDCITDAACSEEISQVKIETVAKEFGSYRIEQRNDQLSILENDSKREVVAARKVFLKSETIPLSENKLGRGDGLVVSPKNKSLTVLTPGIEENPTHWKRENAAYQIVHEGTLQAGPLRFPFQKGQLFNAPYSRYRFKWSSKETRLFSPETAQARSEIIPLLFNHLTELRETHRQLLRCAIENKALVQANNNLKGALQKESDFFGIIGKSAKMKKLIEQVELISQVDSTILITGETGTGKELLAKAIHQSSPRRDQKFVAINCAALSESLLESELFGYEKGAFTGALSQKKGIFEAAHGGTLFLDEVGEISLTMQAKLLRVLEQQEIQRVGGRETIAIDVRILSATNRDLREMVASGKFRSDLYYRLHVISLAVPPLRERFEDLLSLVDYYLNFFSQKSKKKKPVLTREALAALENNPWPGNVRQLKNVIERAVVLDRDQVITPDDLVLPHEGSSPKSEVELQPFHQALDHYRRAVIEEALKKTNGNQTKAAELLGLQRTYLARLIRDLNMSKGEHRS